MKKITVLLMILFIIGYGFNAFARDPRSTMDETHFEAFVGAYHPLTDGLKTTLEGGIGYSFKVHELVTAKIFGSAYQLSPDKDYKEYDDKAQSFDDILTLNLGATGYNYYPVAVGVDSYFEAGVYVCYNNFKYTKNNQVIDKEEFGVGGIVGVGLRIQKFIKVSVHYRYQTNDVNPDGISGEIGFTF